MLFASSCTPTSTVLLGARYQPSLARAGTREKAVPHHSEQARRLDDDRTTLLGAFLELADKLQGQKDKHRETSRADLLARWRHRGLRAFDADKDAAE